MKKRIFATAMALAIVLAAMPGVQAQGTVAFDDVPASHPHKAAIDYCVEFGFFRGMGDGVFGPDESITREQLAVVWARTLQARIPQFSDATQPRDEVDNAIILMYALGYMNGISDTLFGHYGQATREQVLCIAQRHYLRGIKGGDGYQYFDDHEQISAWAQSSVGACLASGLLDGVFSGKELKPQQPMTRAEVCQIIFNAMRQEHTITVTPSEGGMVTPSKTKAYYGDEITLTVTPDDGMQLKPGSLKLDGKAISGLTFLMPAHDVIITAEFEEVPEVVVTLTSISITKEPGTTSFAQGSALSLSGMEITAHYSDDSTKIVTQYTTTPEDGTSLTEVGDVTVTVSYTEDEVTVTDTLVVTVYTEEP